MTLWEINEAYFFNRSGLSNTSILKDFYKCPEPDFTLFTNFTGVPLAVPLWEAILTLLVLGLIILITIVGNILVILSVFTHKPLRIVQNFFIVSLAVADLTVAILVLPLNVAYSLLGRWQFGRLVCTMWLTSDVMCCTASILNLCAIALDRYWAITDPINYAQKRTLRRVNVMIALVWLLSAVICSPPLMGWNDWPEEFDVHTPCQLTSNRGYVVYSSLGSFFFPLLIMTIVYFEIFVATRRRLRDRARASKINIKTPTTVQSNYVQKYQPSLDQESISSDTNNKEETTNIKSEKGERREQKKMQDNRAEFIPPKYSTYDYETKVTEEMRFDMKTGENCTTPPTASQNSSHSKPIPKNITVTISYPPKAVHVYQFIEEKQKISLSKERRAARTLGIIMGVFVLCWLPFFLMYVIVPFCDGCCPSPTFVNVITWLGYINSAINPIIYTIFNLDFRKAFKKLLRIQSNT